MDNAKKKELLARIQKARNREVMSEFIRVQMSDLYDFNPGVRATLSTIAFLQVNDEHAHVPEDSPFKDDYVGWCWASQDYLAKRVGKSLSQLKRDIVRFERDGVLKVRAWRDSNGYPHNEYHVDEDSVTAHQRPKDKDAPRPARSSRDYKTNKGSFSTENQPKSQVASQPLPSSIPAVDRVPSQPSPDSISREGQVASHTLSTAEMPLKGVDPGGCFSGGSFSPSSQDGAQPVPAAPGLDAAGASFKKKKSAEPSPGSWADRNRPVGKITQGEKKPLPNYLCYPEAFKDWRPGRLLPKCRVCGDILQRNENHVCEGFVPKYPDPEVRAAVRSYQTFDDFDEPEEDDPSGYEDFDDDHLPRAAAREEP